MADRRGSREGKGKSLNKIKQAKFKKEKEWNKDKVVITKLNHSAPALPYRLQASNQLEDDEDAAATTTTAAQVRTNANAAATATTTTNEPMEQSNGVESGILIDGLCGLSARVFDRDLNAVINRCGPAKVAAIIVGLTDFTRVDEVIRMVCAYPHTLYAAIGVSPDMLKSHHDKLFEQRMAHLHELALHPEVVAILCGIDASRDISTHHLQSKLLYSQMQLAQSVHLPVVIRDKHATDKIIEAVQSFQTTSKQETSESNQPYPFRIAIAGFNGTDEELRSYVDADCYIIINGQICNLRVEKEEPNGETKSSTTPSNDKSASSENQTEVQSSSLLPELSGEGAPLFRQIRYGLLPLKNVIVGSDAPMFTPQNIPDAYLRQQRNEPSNLPYIFDILSRAYRIPEDELKRIVLNNTQTFYQLQDALNVAPSEDTNSLQTIGVERKNIENNSTKENEEVSVPEKTVLVNNSDSSDDDLDDNEDDEDAPNAVMDLNAVSSKDVHFACHKCRHILFPESNLLSHKTSADANHIEGNVGSEEAHCEIYFLPLSLIMGITEELLKALLAKSRGHAERSNRLECPNCRAKIGRFSIDPTLIPCSCGRLCDTRASTEPIAALSMSRVDAVAYDESFSAPRALLHSQLQIEAERDADESRDVQSKKERSRAKRAAKKVKKQQREDQRGNFTEFRNKNMVHIKSKGKMSAIEEEDDDSD